MEIALDDGVVKAIGVYRDRFEFLHEAFGVGPASIGKIVIIVTSAQR
jgi:hypothetical protein